MKTTKVTCAYCGTRFNRAVKEVTRSAKLGRPSFCCRAHSVAAGNAIAPRGNRIPPIRGDHLSCFRYYIRKSNASNRIHGNKLTLLELEQQWTAQDGKCAYTGLPMVLPDSVGGWKAGATPFAASLDRKDSRLGYTVDNVEFVCRFVNLGKNKFTEAQTREFITAVRSHALQSQ